MRYLLGSLLVLVAFCAQAAELIVTVPTGEASANAILQCENIRLFYHFTVDDWNGEEAPEPVTSDDYDMCATMMARAGVETATIQEANAAHQATISACVSAANNIRQGAINDFDAAWLLPATPARCGDGNINVNVGLPDEDCDDSGESGTCNENCTTSVCGDGVLNVTAGEGCDDGNTDAGDGCDASCQIEL